MELGPRLVNRSGSDRIILNPNLYLFILSDSDRIGTGFFTGRSISRSVRITDHGSDIWIHLTFYDFIYLDLKALVTLIYHNSDTDRLRWKYKHIKEFKFCIRILAHQAPSINVTEPPSHYFMYTRHNSYFDWNF